MSNPRRPIIMLVDDNHANLSIGKNILKDLYEVYALPSAERLFKFLETVTPDLILLDVEMPNMNGFDVIRIIKSDPHYSDVPIIFVTSKVQEVDELEGLALGAVDYVAKPFSAAILLKRIENHLLIKKQRMELKDLNDNLIEMIKEKTAQVFRLQGSIINSMAEIVEFRDAFTGAHIYRTQKYVQLLIDYVVEHNIYSDEILKLADMHFVAEATQLHDLGKIFIDGAILNKAGSLTPDEFAIMKTHVSQGVEAIRHMRSKGPEQSFLDCAETIAKTHHEKWNGTGYPRGLKGVEIPLLGRLMSIADVYDALTSARPYKEPLSTRESAQIIIKDSGTHFDPVLVEAFKGLEGTFASIAQNNEHRIEVS